MGSDAARDRWFEMFKEILTTCWDYCTCQGEYASGKGRPNIM